MARTRKMMTKSNVTKDCGEFHGPSFLEGCMKKQFLFEVLFWLRSRIINEIPIIILFCGNTIKVTMDTEGCWGTAEPKIPLFAKVRAVTIVRDDEGEISSVTISL